MASASEVEPGILVELLDTLPQSGQHPAAGNVDGPGGKAELFRHHRDGLILDARLPERLPGGSAEFGLYLLRGPPEGTALELGPELSRGSTSLSRLRFQQFLHACAAGAVDPPPLAGQEPEQQVAGNPEQPGAKPTLGRVGVPAIDGRGHRAKNFLAQISGVGVLKALAASQLVDQRFVNLYEFCPCRLIARVPQSQHQTVPCAWLHACPSISSSAGSGKSFSSLRVFRPSADPVSIDDFFVQIDAETGFLRHGNVAIDDGKPLLRQGRPQCPLFEAVLEVVGVGEAGNEVQTGSDVDSGLVRMVYTQAMPVGRIPADPFGAGQAPYPGHIDLDDIDAALIHHLSKFADITDFFAGGNPNRTLAA